MTASDIIRSNGGPTATVNGETVSVVVRDGVVYVNDARVITADINASNGIVHLIDTVLLPPQAAGAGN